MKVVPAIRFNSLLFTCAVMLTMAALPSCNVNTTPPAAQQTDTAASYAHTEPTDSTALRPDSGDHAILYFTIADTGQHYSVLNKTMYALHKTLNWPVDTMGRYYNAKKD